MTDIQAAISTAREWEEQASPRPWTAKVSDSPATGNVFLSSGEVIAAFYPPDEAMIVEEEALAAAEANAKLATLGLLAVDAIAALYDSRAGRGDFWGKGQVVLERFKDHVKEIES